MCYFLLLLKFVRASRLKPSSERAGNATIHPSGFALEQSYGAFSEIYSAHPFFVLHDDERVIVTTCHYRRIPSRYCCFQEVYVAAKENCSSTNTLL